MLPGRSSGQPPMSCGSGALPQPGSWLMRPSEWRRQRGRSRWPLVQRLRRRRRLRRRGRWPPGRRPPPRRPRLKPSLGLARRSPSGQMSWHGCSLPRQTLKMAPTHARVPRRARLASRHRRRRAAKRWLRQTWLGCSISSIGSSGSRSQAVPAAPGSRASRRLRGGRCGVRAASSPAACSGSVARPGSRSHSSRSRPR